MEIKAMVLGQISQARKGKNTSFPSCEVYILHIHSMKAAGDE